MSPGAWRVEFTTRSADETRGLPDHAFDALMKVLGEVAHDPWRASRQQPGVDAHARTADFAETGIATLTLDPAARTVRVRTVTWVG